MASNDDFREAERRRVARCMQEKAENSKEVAQALHVWKARMVANDQCMVLPGDYMAVGRCCMCSSRGAMIDMAEGDIQALVESGALSRVFDNDDLNAPDFHDVLDGVLDKIAAQREFRDASCYYCSHGLEQAVAVWDIPPDPDGMQPGCTAAVGRSGAEFGFGDDLVSTDLPLRQCSYEEFNPGGADIMAAVRAEAKPEQGRSQKSMFQEMQEKYLADGENDIAKPDDLVKRVPGWDKMSPSERMALQVQASDEYHRALERQAAQEQGPDAADQWGPRLPGGRRTDML